MSINNSYFSRNNTIVYNSYVNTGRNPVMQLYYGDGGLVNPIGKINNWCYFYRMY